MKSSLAVSSGAQRLVAGARRPARGSRRGQVKVQAAGLSREQEEFLARRAQEARSAPPAEAPTRGRSGSSRPASLRPSSRPASAAPAQQSSTSWSAPAAPSSASGGLAPRASSRQPSLRPSSRQPSVRPTSTTPSSFSAPAAPAASSGGAAGLSAEQQEFLRRRASESPARRDEPEVRGRSAVTRQPSVRPSSRPATPTRTASSTPSYSAPAASYTPPPAASSASGGLPPRPSSRPPSLRPSSRQPSVRPTSTTPTSFSAPAAPAAASYSAPAASGGAAGLSAEQQEFLRRRQSESPQRGSAPETRGRSAVTRQPSVRPSSRPATPTRAASPAPAYQAPAPAAPVPSPYDSSAQRAALERNVQSTVPHPRDVSTSVVPAPPPPGARWPDQAFMQACWTSFPDKGVATPDEARALIDLGYKLLDVRTELESNARGKVKGAVMIPCAFARQTFDAASGQMVTTESDNPQFLAQVARKFPKKDARILVACRNGSDYSIDVLEALEDEGYTHIVGLQGGMNALNRIFDLKLNPRDGRPVAKRAMKKLL